MDKYQKFLFSLLLMFPASALCEPTFKVGVMLPMSGDTAYIGTACKNGMDLAQERLNPKLKDKLKFRFEDHRFDSKTSISVFRRFVHEDEVDAIVNFSSNTGKATAPLADSKRIPMIALASDPGVVAGRTHVVNFWVTPEEQAKVLVNELGYRGIRTIARISAIHNATESWNKAFDRFRKDSIQIALDQEFPLDTKDFKPFLIRLQKEQSQVDAVFVNLFFGQVGVFAKQARELGIELPLFNIETFEDVNEVKNSGGALIEQWYIQSDDGRESFISKYQKRFPGSSIYGAANCYDIVLLLAHAAEHGMTKDDFNDYLHSVEKFEGATGTFSASQDNRFTLPATVKVVTKRGFEKAIR